MKNFAVFALLHVVIAFGGMTKTRASPVRGPFPSDITIREDVKVTLRIPYEVLLANEAFTGYLSIQNLSDTPLTVQTPPPAETGDQIIYEFRASPESSVVSEAPFWPEWEIMTSRNPVTQLGQGDYVWHDIYRIGFTVRMAPDGTNEARAGIITGTNEWAFSEWTPVRRNTDRVEDGVILLTFLFDRGGFAPFPRTVRVTKVNDESYIFFERRRLARVPIGASPRAVWDNDTGNLTIHYDGVDVPASVFRISQPVEWTPETVPHMQVLEELKAELEINRDVLIKNEQNEPALNSPTERTHAPQTDDEAAPRFQSDEKPVAQPEPEPPPARHFLPVLLAFFLLSGVAALVLNRKRRS